MELREILQALGTDRVIWIDDKFNRTPAQLADQLVASPELARKAGNAAVNTALDNYEFQEGSNGLDELRQVLLDMSPTDRDALSKAFFDAETAAVPMAAPELSDQVIEVACSLLNIRPEDRWTFSDAM